VSCAPAPVFDEKLRDAYDYMLVGWNEAAKTTATLPTSPASTPRTFADSGADTAIAGVPVTGEPALAIANYADEKVYVEIDGIDAQLTYRLIGQDEWEKSNGRISLPARSAVVAMPAHSAKTMHHL
jgi:hypothetical protein